MRSISPIVIALLMPFGASAYGQSGAQPKAAKPKQNAVTKIEAPAPKLSDSFAKASLLALKSLETEGSLPTMIDGQLYVSRRTPDLIDAAEVEAISDPERAVSKALSRIYDGKLLDNERRETIRLRHQIDAYKKSSYEIESGQSPDRQDAARHATSDLSIAAATNADPETVAIQKREDECFAAFDAMLRLRSIVVPSQCDALPGKSTAEP